MQGIIEDVTSLFQKSLLDMHLSIKMERNLTTEAITSLEPIFSPVGKYGQPFKGLETQHRQMEYFKKRCGYSSGSRILFSELFFRQCWHLENFQRLKI